MARNFRTCLDEMEPAEVSGFGQAIGVRFPKVLTLINGDRISMPPTVRLLFEVALDNRCVLCGHVA